MEVGALRIARYGSSIGFLFVWMSVIGVVFSRTLTENPCDSMNQRELHTLKSDQITVLINGYSESRIPLLRSIVASYSGSPIVSSVLVLWGNPSTPAQVVDQLARNLTQYSLGTAVISLVQQSSRSLNARFLPRSSIETRAVLICDDDVEIDSRSLEFAFRVWKSNPDRLIGLFVRSHDMDLQRKEWIYTIHPNKYSIVLTKFMMMKQDYLFGYSCGDRLELKEMRRIVDEMHNCEDILMNFVVSDKINAGPIMVGAERVRDWGDARNEDRNYQDGTGSTGLERAENKNVREVGLSSRKGEHRKRRGKCVTEFHRVLGRMPLRYSYGKVVNSVGEQGLCNKAGKLVFCDQD